MSGADMEDRALTPNREAELRLLYAEYAEAAAKASMILSLRGAQSRQFRDADEQVNHHWKRIRGILAVAKEGW
jgi:hypothetical protein